MSILSSSVFSGRGLLVAGLLGMLSLGAAQAQIAPAQCNNQKFLADRAGFLQTGPTRVDLPEHVCGQVVSMTQRSRRTRSGVHGYFMMQVAPGHQIRIVSDLDRMQAPDWPWVKPGDPVEVVGRYYFDSARSQGIDWTHHGTGRHWANPGYVQVNGSQYE